MYTLVREIEVKPSRLLGVLLAGMIGLALASIWLAALPSVAGGAALAIGVLGGLAWYWRRIRAASTIRIAADGRLQCREAGAWHDMEVLGDSLASPFLIVLRYRSAASAGAQTRVLLPDSAAADDLRRLRVSLRWIRRTHSDTSSPGAG